MSFAAPLALLLFAPLIVLMWLLRGPFLRATARLPGTWARVISPALQHTIATSSHVNSASPWKTNLAVSVLVILALSRPGWDIHKAQDVAMLAGRVVVLDVGADLARHRQFLDELYRADQTVATSVVAVSGDAYRITPFTTDKSYIDRYVRVLGADLMPRPGQRPHLGLARAERLLENAGYPIGQIVFLSARQAPDEIIQISETDAHRVVVNLASAAGWSEWADLQNAIILDRNAARQVADLLNRSAQDLARSELPETRFEFSTLLIVLAAAFWLFKFRRSAA